MDEKLNELTFPNAAIFGLLIAAAYWMFFYHPSDPKVQLQTLSDEISEAEGQISRLNREIKIGQELNKEIQLMEARAKKVYEQLQEQITTEEASGTISEEARSLGLSIQEITATGGWVKKKTIAVAEINAQVVGTFVQIMIFLSELTRNNKVYSVEGLTISGAEGDESNNGFLSLNAKINAYRKLSVVEIKALEEEEDEI